MKSTRILWIASLLAVIAVGYAGQDSGISVAMDPAHSFIVSIDHGFHMRYGCSYPMTFQFDIPRGGGRLRALRRFANEGNWDTLQEKTSGDFYNALEVVRFDSSDGKAFVSIAFSAVSDSLFIQICDTLSNPVAAQFGGICRYYDNRTAVVTVSADDWSDWVVQDGEFTTLLDIFRSYQLYVTVGVITAAENTTRSSWFALQQQLDSGFVEAASHSRTHPDTPYADPFGEVVGSSQDIKNALTLPPLFSANGTKYIYTWIAPYGEIDSTIDSLTGVAGYLADRLYTNLDTTAPRIYVYGDSTLSAWDPRRDHFRPFWPTVELGAPSWGGGDTSLASLNGLFDTIAAKGGIYHCMWHPQVLYADRDMPYLRNHLQHISNRPNIWYVNLGHLYLYSLIQQSSSPTVTTVDRKTNGAWEFRLLQNYPNPFNPSTTISFSLPRQSFVTLKVFNLLGEGVATLVEGVQQEGNTSVRFDGSRLPSGVYIYRLEAGSFFEMRKLLLVK